MKGNAKRRRLKRELWKELLKKKWDEVNKIPKRQPVTQVKTNAS